MHKRLFHTGIAAYVVMLVLSVVFYKERTVLNDAAYNLFYILKDGTFCFPSFRFGEAFTQAFPLLGYKAGAPLEYILILYSSGFILFYFACYLVAGAVLKQYEFALGILLFHVLFATESFYYIPSALIQGTTLLLVVLAFLAAYRESPRPFLVFLQVLLAVLLAFFHPLMVFVVAYAVLFFLWDKEYLIRRMDLIRFGVIFFGALVLKMLLLRLPYETHALGGLKNFVTQFPDYFSLYSHQHFFRLCLTSYYWLPLLFAGIAVFYLMQKKRAKFSFFIIPVVGYYFLINISYPDASTPVFYLENLYMPLAIFLILPLCFDVMPAMQGRATVVLFAVIVITGCVRIFYTHNKYTARLGWERRFMQQHAGKKMICSTKLAPMDTLMETWGTPYEFWLLSTVENKSTASIIIDPRPEDRSWAAYLTASFVVNWYTYSYRELDHRYFIFTDSASRYVINPVQ